MLSLLVIIQLLKWLLCHFYDVWYLRFFRYVLCPFRISNQMAAGVCQCTEISRNFPLIFYDIIVTDLLRLLVGYRSADKAADYIYI